ncbi:hypothetical protein LOC54_11090 [Acetobacter sp. AN02]|uniref:hypothetical protein n=1 Tax=Acetobacter sp. AN02 TaxID=2894186 RepID=UPI0024343531|nr:hypothetical protein [Acetobacter sp. AN02]MDG6095624.1 hypothetical protein [Acetobacter sp. AN02]
MTSAQDRARILEETLLASDSATRVLESYIAGAGEQGPLRAVRQNGPAQPCPAELAKALGAVGKTPEYRRVRLICGRFTLSEAENWYLPEYLSAEMNRQLETTEIPFGQVVAALGFSRRLIRRERTEAADSPILFRHQAVLLNRDGRPFSAVSEAYRRDAVLGIASRTP